MYHAWTKTFIGIVDFCDFVTIYSLKCAAVKSNSETKQAQANTCTVPKYTKKKKTLVEL